MNFYNVSKLAGKVNGQNALFGIIKFKPTIMAQEALENLLCNAASSLDSFLGCHYPNTNPFY